MKHRGCLSDFIPQRNLELMQAYRRACDSTQFIIQRKVCEVVANSPCSRFWVSEERAKAVVSDILKGRYILDGMLPMKREMYIEIFRRSQALREDAPLFDIVMLAVNSPSPKFYMTPDSVLQIVWIIRRGHYKVRHNHHVY